MVIQCKGSFDRIQEYCNYSMDSTEDDIASRHSVEPHVDTNSKNKLQALSPQEDTIGCGQLRYGQTTCLKGRSFAWDKTGPPFLKDLNITIEPHAINVVIGPIGSGKSALLNSLLGEMVEATSEQSRQHRETMAYCAQKPWLENRKIRQNIIGVLPYDGGWYETVKWACGLNVDIDQLDKRDETRVGSQGLNLSGGQKQRIVSVNGWAK